jgi:hypothetical protein
MEHKLLVCIDGVNLMDENINTVWKTTALLDVSKGVL